MNRSVENVLQLFKRKIEAPNDDSYVRSIIITEDGEEFEVDLFKEIRKCLNNDKDVLIWDNELIGGFESPGYDLSCYSLCVFYKDSELKIYPINIEFF